MNVNAGPGESTSNALGWIVNLIIFMCVSSYFLSCFVSFSILHSCFGWPVPACAPSLSLYCVLLLWRALDPVRAFWANERRKTFVTFLCSSFGIWGGGLGIWLEKYRMNHTAYVCMSPNVCALPPVRLWAVCRAKWILTNELLPIWFRPFFGLVSFWALVCSSACRVGVSFFLFSFQLLFSPFALFLFRYNWI